MGFRLLSKIETGRRWNGLGRGASDAATRRNCRRRGLELASDRVRRRALPDARSFAVLNAD